MTQNILIMSELYQFVYGQDDAKTNKRFKVVSASFVTL